MKKISRCSVVRVLIVIVAMLSIPVTACAAISDNNSGISGLYMDVVTSNVNPNVATILLKAKDINNVGILRLDITYDPKVMQVSDVEKGEAISGAVFKYVIDKKGGRVAIDIKSDKEGEGFSYENGGFGLIAKIDVLGIGEKGSSSDLMINVLDIRDPQMHRLRIPKTNMLKFVVVGNSSVVAPPNDKGTPTDTAKDYNGGVFVGVIIVIIFAILLFLTLQKRRKG